MRIFSSLDIRWKLQIGFMIVTMLTAIFHRLLAAKEMKIFIDIARKNGVSEQVLHQMVERYDTFIFNSYWESGIEFVCQFIVIGIVAKIFLKPILSLCQSVEAIEHGDLTQEAKVTTHDEIGVLGEHFNIMRLRLSRIIGSVDESALHMSQSAYQIGEIAHEIEEISNDQTRQSQEVMHASQSLNDISQQVLVVSDKTSQQAQKMTQNSKSAIAKVEGNVKRLTLVKESFSKVAHEVNQMSENSKSILEIVSVIRSIAGQTNLLALNAAIEAARAGESGRGFAVVADEVRLLAQRTTDSSEEVEVVLKALTEKMQVIRELIESSGEEMEITTDNFVDTSKDLGLLENDIETTSELNQQIKDQVNEQINIFSALNGRLSSLFDQLEKNALRISNTANIGDSLFELTNNLNQQLSGLKYEKKAKKEQHVERKHPRIESHLLVSVKVEDRWLDGITEDMSFSGMGLKFHHPLVKGQKISLSIKMPKDDFNDYLHQGDLVLDGEIMRVDAEHEVYGVRFIDPEKQEEALVQCLEFYSNPRNHLQLAKVS